jgi:K+-sensing histidine kinase KdpD
MSNENNGSPEHRQPFGGAMPSSADRLSLKSQRIALITGDAQLAQRFTAILADFDVLHMNPLDPFFAMEHDFFYLFDVRQDSQLLANRLTKIDGPCIAITDTVEHEELAALFNVGFTDILPIALLDAPLAVQHLVTTGMVRKEAVKGKTSPAQAPKNLVDFATALMKADGSEAAVGEAVIAAARSLGAIAAGIYTVDNKDLVLLAEFGYSPEELAKLSRSSLTCPNPFALSVNSHKAAWLKGDNLLKSGQSGRASNGMVGILPCCLDKKMFGVLKLVFADRTIVKAATKSTAKKLSALTAQALKNARKLHALVNQKAYAIQMLGMASHDLRNPLNTLQLSTELVRLECEASNLVCTAIPCMSKAIKQANTIIETLLDFTRAQLNGGIPIYPRATSMDRILNDVLEELKLQAPKRQVKLSAVGHFEGQWDVERMRQVLNNLIGNAHRYAPFEETLHVLLDGHGENVYVTISNAHPVIPLATLASLFEPMVQADKPSPTSKGLGLGLYIARQLVTAHQGRVWAASDHESGTVFTIELPRTSTPLTDRN